MSASSGPDHISDAKLAAQFFQALLIEGVAPDAAVLLTNNYVMGTVAIRMQRLTSSTPVTTTAS
jgi:hypothetical protein